MALPLIGSNNHNNECNILEAALKDNFPVHKSILQSIKYIIYIFYL